MVEEGKFRQDLYFRLNVARIFLPPLRDRRDDIPLIVAHLAAKHAGAGGRSAAAAPKPIDAEVMARLIDYRWPGNVRELENEIMRAMALSGERITVADLSPQVAARGDGRGGRRRGSRQPVPAPARRAARALADPRGAGPLRQQPDQGRGGIGFVALRFAEEAAPVQLCLSGRRHNQVGRSANLVVGVNRRKARKTVAGAPDRRLLTLSVKGSRTSAMKSRSLLATTAAAALGAGGGGLPAGLQRAVHPGPAAGQHLHVRSRSPTAPATPGPSGSPRASPTRARAWRRSTSSTTPAVPA